MAVEKAKDTAAEAVAESAYSPREIASASLARFGIGQDIALAALTIDGKASYTLTEAKTIIEKFATKEVN